MIHWNVLFVARNLAYKDYLIDIWNVILMLNVIHVLIVEKDLTILSTSKDILEHIVVLDHTSVNIVKNHLHKDALLSPIP